MDEGSFCGQENDVNCAGGYSPIVNHPVKFRGQGLCAVVEFLFLIMLDMSRSTSLNLVYKY